MARAVLTRKGKSYWRRAWSLFSKLIFETLPENYRRSGTHFANTGAEGKSSYTRKGKSCWRRGGVRGLKLIFETENYHRSLHCFACNHGDLFGQAGGAILRRTLLWSCFILWTNHCRPFPWWDSRFYSWDVWSWYYSYQMLRSIRKIQMALPPALLVLEDPRSIGPMSNG